MLHFRFSFRPRAMTSNAPVSPSTAGMLRQVQGDLETWAASTKQEMQGIESRIGIALTEVNAKMTEMSQNMLTMRAAGEAVIQKVEAEKAETVTVIEQVKSAATSEFTTHRAAIEEIVGEVKNTQQTPQQPATTVQADLDGMSGASSGGKP